jgi:hypothetical protein
MPYSQYKDGGYKKLECGYGWKKDSNDACTKEKWYTPETEGCYATTIIINKQSGHGGCGYEGCDKQEQCYGDDCKTSANKNTCAGEKTVTSTVKETMKETVTMTQTMKETVTGMSICFCLCTSHPPFLLL